MSYEKRVGRVMVMLWILRVFCIFILQVFKNALIRYSYICDPYYVFHLLKLEEIKRNFTSYGASVLFQVFFKISMLILASTKGGKVLSRSIFWRGIFCSQHSI